MSALQPNQTMVPPTLLTLPPEIRTRIFQFIFEHDEPLIANRFSMWSEDDRVMLHSILRDTADERLLRAGKPSSSHHSMMLTSTAGTRDPDCNDAQARDATNEGWVSLFGDGTREPADDNDAEDQEEQDDAAQVIQTVEAYDGRVIEAYQPALALFLTCKQIHKEAASMFYCNNTFLMVMQPDAKDEDGPKFDTLLPQWLWQLPSYIPLLRNLELDDNLFYKLNKEALEMSLDHTVYFDVADLMLALWNDSFWVEGKLDLKVSLVHVEAQDWDEDDNGPLKITKTPIDHTDEISDAIRELQEDSYLSSRWRLVSHIGLAEDGSRAVTIWSNIPRECDGRHTRYDEVAFAYVDRLNWKFFVPFSPRVAPIDYNELPSHIRDRFSLWAITFPEVQKLSAKNAVLIPL